MRHREHFDITEFGAVSDGVTNSRAAIQAAIDLCGTRGGGTVYIPPGVFVTGTIYLRSHVELRLDSGATLRASPHNDDFDESPANPHSVLPVPPDHWHAAFIVARGVDHVTISGAGCIRGRGFGLGRTDVPTDFRPRLVSIEDCSFVTIDGVTFADQDRWCLHLFRSDFVKVRGVTVRSHPDVLATDDGIDIDGCRNVVVSDCLFSTGDDAICVKTSDYLGDSRSSDNIAISNCTALTGTCGVKIGARESVNTVSNVIIRGVSVIGRAAIHIDIYGGGTYRQILIDGIVARITRSDDEVQRRVRPGLTTTDLNGRPVADQVDTVRVANYSESGGTINDLVIANSIFFDTIPARYRFMGSSVGQFNGIALRDVSIRGGGSANGDATVFVSDVDRLALANVSIEYDAQPATPRSAVRLERVRRASITNLQVDRSQSPVGSIQVDNSESVYLDEPTASLLHQN